MASGKMHRLLVCYMPLACPAPRDQSEGNKATFAAQARLPEAPGWPIAARNPFEPPPRTAHAWQQSPKTQSSIQQQNGRLESHE